MAEINYLAVLVAAIATMVVGFLWFGPLFGKKWAEGQGWTAADRDKAKNMNMTGLYVQQFIASLIMAYVLAHIVWGMNMALDRDPDLMSGISTGFWMWLGFIVPLKWGDMLWSGKKFKYASIEFGYWLVNLVVMGIIISLWQ